MKLVYITSQMSKSENGEPFKLHHLMVGTLAQVKSASAITLNVVGVSGMSGNPLDQVIYSEHYRKLKNTKKNLRAFAKQFR